jgi:hypothetical protein
MPQWDFFMAHSSNDSEVAESLYFELICHHARVFLDTQCILPGDDWDKTIRDAQRNSRITIILVSSTTEEAYYEREEIANAVALSRKSSNSHRVVPIFIGNHSKKSDSIPYGLRLKQSLIVSDECDLAAVAVQLIKLLVTLKKRRGKRENYQARPEEDTLITRVAQPTVSLGRLPSTGKDLFGRARDLALLDKFWLSKVTNVATIIAWGGVGKSALLNGWLDRMALVGFRGAERVWGWSFYKQGTREAIASAESFVESALQWFGDDNPTSGSSWQKGERLARLVRSKRTLLVIDGLEPLQHPIGPNEGKLKDPAMVALLRELATQNDGLCLVSSRLPVTDLRHFESTSAPRVDLDHISSTAGTRLLISLGVRGTKTEMKSAAVAFKGHPLTLTLLGTFLTEVHDGDIKEWRTVHLLEEDLERGGQAHRVLKAYEDWLDDRPEIWILRLLGFFDRPVPQDVIDILRARPPVRGLNNGLTRLQGHEWARALTHLRRMKLIYENQALQSDAIDAHPLVREYFGAQIAEKFHTAWTEGNRRLFAYYSTKGEALPGTLEEMEPIFLAVMHACRAKLYREALHDLYLSRIMRGSELFAASQLGAVSALVSALSNFFPDNSDWASPAPDLSQEDQGIVLIQAGR